MNDIECPYCDYEQEVNHNDGSNFAEDERHYMSCGQCEKEFTFWTSISLSYSAEKADCLNGEPHDLQPTNVYPKIAACVRCTVCDTEDYKATAEYRKQVREESKQQGLNEIGIPD
jgi:hypothetical protein